MVGAATLLTALAALSPVAVATPRKRAAPQKLTLEYRVKDTDPKPQKFAVSSDASIENLDGFRWNQNYAMKLWAGTPRQQMTLIVDTGSADIIMWGQGCNNCRPPVFNWQDSTTYSPENKNATLDFIGGSTISGPVAVDTFTIGSFTQNYSFINVQDVDYQTAQNFPAGEQGIIGMGFPWSFGTGKSWAQEAALNQWPEPTFGVWLGQPDFQQELTPHAGEIVLGGVDDAKFAGRPYTQYPLIEAGDQRWNIEMGGVRVNGEGIPLAGGRRALIDTGSELTQVPMEMCEALKDKIPGAFLASQGPDTTAIYAPCNSTAAVEFQFGNIWYPLAARDLLYLPERNSQNPNCLSSYYCQRTTAESGFDYLLGANFLRNVYSSYSYQPKQVGLAPLADRRGDWDYGWNAGPEPSTSAPPAESTTTPPAETTTPPAETTTPPAETTTPPAETTTPPVETTTPPAETSTPPAETTTPPAETTTPPAETTTPPAETTTPPAETTTPPGETTSSGTTTPPTEPTTSPAPPVEPTTSAAPPVEPTTSPAPPAETTTSAAPPVEPTTSPAPPVEPTTSPAPPVEPTTSPAPPVETTTSPAPPVEPTISAPPPVEPTTSPAAPAETTTGPAPPVEPTTSPAPPVDTTAVPPPAETSVAPPPGETSPAPPAETSVAPPPGETSAAPPAETSVPPEGTGTAAPPVSTSGPVNPVPPPTKPCPCHKGDIYWYWDGRRWRLVSWGWRWWWSGGNRYGRPKGHVWRWNRYGQFGVVAPNSDRLLQYSAEAEKVAEGKA